MRFRLISGRIRALVGGEHLLDPSLVEQIRNTQPDSEMLLPNATHLTWATYDASDPSQALLFMGPQTKNVTLAVDTLYPEGFASLCPITSPNITDLTLHIREDPQVAVDVLAELIAGLPGLERLQVPESWDMDMTRLITSAALHPKLCKLEVSGHGSSWITKAPSPTQPLPARLTELNLSIQLGQELIDLIEFLAPYERLHTFRLKTDGGRRTKLEVLPQMFQAVGLQKQISSIVLQLHKVQLITTRELLCLSECTLIQTLCISTQGCLTLSDGALGRLVGKMTGLKKLVLEGKGTLPGIPEAPGLTLAAFGIVTARCPSIDHIALPVRSSTSCIPRSESFRSSKTLSLIRIQLTEATNIDDPEAVATFISHLSDAVDFSVIVYPGDAGTTTEMWTKVEEMMPGLQAARLAGVRM